MHGGNYTFSYNTDGEETREREVVQNCHRRRQKCRQKYNTGGTSVAGTSSTGFLYADVTGDWEQWELNIHKFVT